MSKGHARSVRNVDTHRSSPQLRDEARATEIRENHLQRIHVHDKHVLGFDVDVGVAIGVKVLYVKLLSWMEDALARKNIPPGYQEPDDSNSTA